MENVEAGWFLKFAEKYDQEELLKQYFLAEFEDNSELEEEMTEFLEDEGETYCPRCKAITEHSYRMTYSAGVSPEEGVYYCSECED